MISVNSLLYCLHLWFAGDFLGAWWTPPGVLWFVMTVVTLLGAAWAWRRHFRMATGEQVIPEAPHPEMRPCDAGEIAAVQRRHDLPERYLVWVGSLEHPDPGQHVAKLAAASRELPLVLVGPTRPWAHELPGVKLTGHVGESDLAAILAGAQALVLPSEDEGLGLPAVEALACGTPVVAFDVPAVRELLGDRAVLVAPGDVPGLIAAAQLAAPPPALPTAWTWHDAARETWRVYAQAARMAAPRPRPGRAAARAASPGYR